MCMPARQEAQQHLLCDSCCGQSSSASPCRGHFTPGVLGCADAAQHCSPQDRGLRDCLLARRHNSPFPANPVMGQSSSTPPCWGHLTPGFPPAAPMLRITETLRTEAYGNACSPGGTTATSLQTLTLALPAAHRPAEDTSRPGPPWLRRRCAPQVLSRQRRTGVPVVIRPVGTTLANADLGLTSSAAPF